MCYVYACVNILFLYYRFTYIVITYIWGSKSFFLSSVSWFLCTVEVFRLTESVSGYFCSICTRDLWCES